VAEATFASRKYGGEVNIIKDRTDYYGGALIMLIGLGAFLGASDYRIGSLRHMGPGFFPAVLGAIMVICGVLIAVHGASPREGASVRRKEEWRGWLCILSGLVSFIVVGHYVGLLPATFSIVFLTALGDRKNSLKAATVLSVSMCLVATIVFWWVLQLQFPLIAWDWS
jgi:hypothetical protein